MSFMLSSGPMADTPPSTSLTRRQKAAVIVRLLLDEGAELPIANLPDDMQADLTEAMGELRAIDRATLRQVVEEFASELDAIGLAFPSGIDGALGVLEGHISAATANRLRRQALLAGRSDPWARILSLSVQQLQTILEEESVEVGAVILSKLSVARAAELLGKIPGEKARRLARAIADTSKIGPETVRRIGLAIVRQVESEPESAFPAAPEDRVGAILNFSAAGTREDVLQALEAEDAAFAAEVRKRIFTFPDIADRVEPRDIPKVAREVDATTLMTALAAAIQRGEKDAEAAEFILSNMSKRMADQLREEIGERGKIKDKDADSAMAAVIEAIRELDSRGEIVMRTGEDE